MSAVHHPEVVHSAEGGRLLANFVKDICGARADWSMSRHIDSQIAAIRQTVGKRRCSAVSPVESILQCLRSTHPPKRSEINWSACVLNNGLLRKGEADLYSLSSVTIFISGCSMPHARTQFLDAFERL